MLRVLREPFVVLPPAGVTLTTRLRPTPGEEVLLREVGAFLGVLYRRDLVTRLGQGKLNAQGENESRKVRKQELTAGSSSRWAGSITGAAKDQYDLGMRTLTAERDMLVCATEKLTERIAAPVGGQTGKIKGHRSCWCLWGEVREPNHPR